MIDICPYCKVRGTRRPRIVCTNCRNYAEAAAADREEAELRELCRRYRTLPFDWRDSDGWRTDPYYLK